MYIPVDFKASVFSTMQQQEKHQVKSESTKVKKLNGVLIRTKNRA